MNELQKALQEYLAIRRSLGVKLARAEKLLHQFRAYMDHVGAAFVTIDVAVAWAMQPPDGTSGWRAHRLSVVRGFARHLHAIDPRHHVPPTDLLVGGRSRRATPYPYSPQDIAGLMAAARSLRRLRNQERFFHLDDMGDQWQHSCKVDTIPRDILRTLPNPRRRPNHGACAPVRRYRPLARQYPRSDDD
ncbi:MAG: hypothetical protein M3N98_03100 [Actinomycetota bacterium]|nr:hypothetical protein [Actinomycetota bacterium]